MTATVTAGARLTVKTLLDELLAIPYFRPFGDEPAAIPFVRSNGVTPLVVMVGDNASGKSFARRLVFALCQKRATESHPPVDGRTPHGERRMKTARKDFPLAVVLTLVTDVLMHLPIEDVFTCASHVIGYPIAQHELSDHRTAIKKVIFAQHPELADLSHVKAGRRDAATYLPKYVERQIAKFGKTVSLAHGKAKRTEDPIDSLRRRAPHMGVIIAADDKPRRPKHA